METAEDRNIRGLEKDFGHQKQEWKVEKLGWLVMGLFLLAGTLGFLGPGVFSERTLDRDGTHIRYHAFCRSQASTALHITAGTERESDTLRIAVSRNFIDAVELEGIDPEPENSVIAGDRIVYNFLSPGNTTRPEVAFRFKGEEFGSIPVRIKIDGQEEIPFSIMFVP